MENIKKIGYYLEEEIIPVKNESPYYIKFSTSYNYHNNNGHASFGRPQKYHAIFNIFDNIYVANGFSTIIQMQGLEGIFLELRDRPLLIDIQSTILDKTIQYFGGKEEFEKMLIFKERYISTNHSSMILILLDMTKYKTQ